MSRRPETAPLLRALAATRDRWRQLALATLLGAGAVLAAVGLLATSGYLISRAAQRPEILSLTMAIVGVRFFGIVRAVLRYLERLVSHDMAFRALGELRTRLFARLVPLVPGGLGTERRGELLSRFVADVDTLQDLYLRALLPPLTALVAGAGALVICALLLPAAALVLAVALLAAALIVPALTRALARAAGRKQAPARAALSVELVEIVDGSTELALAGREADWIERADRAGRRLARVQVRDAVAGGLGGGLGTALSAATVVAVAAVAISAAGAGALAGVLIAAVTLLAMASFEAVAPLPAAAGAIDRCATAAGRLEAVSELPAPIAEPAEPEPLPEQGPLRLEGVRFRYGPGTEWVLGGVDLELEPGRAIALVGPSGAGKTTLAELCVRFADPSGGRVTLGGVDLRALSSERVREAITLAAQDAHVFATTVRDNLAFAAPEAADADRLRALERVGLGEWAAGLPEGLSTRVGELGAKLSGGQRQRLCTARALLGGGRFLILDEPTAHLDAAGAAELLGELCSEAGRGDRGVLVITHEAEELTAFDRVLSLEGGRLRDL